ncbi:hypothetical protein [Nitrosovibrio tenuis]|uniref:hypothetical protein n=1 Tax=Nitrosovibrio tenuis TaxID=1233 RepID=UPI000B8901EB|nr:hypothetical protein [Nitrosovibrio tenuis]
MTEEKPSNKPDATNQAKKTGKKQSKQESEKNAENYEGAQPPQGGRLGQGRDHANAQPTDHVHAQ